MQLPLLLQESLERVKGGVAAGWPAAYCVTVSCWACWQPHWQRWAYSSPPRLAQRDSSHYCVSVDNNHSANDSNNHHHTSKTSYRQRQPAKGGQPLVTPREPPWEMATKTKQQTVALVIITVTASPGELLTKKQWAPSLIPAPRAHQSPAQSRSPGRGAQALHSPFPKTSHSWEFSIAGRLQRPHVSLRLRCFKGHNRVSSQPNTNSGGNFCANFTTSK